MLRGSVFVATSVYTMVRQRHRQVEREGGNVEDLKISKKKARKEEEGGGSMYLMAGIVSLGKG